MPVVVRHHHSKVHCTGQLVHFVGHHQEETHVGDLGKTVGANQKQIRTQRGLTLDALAAASGISRSNLAAIESGKANPSIATLWQIATALKVGFSELVAVLDGGTHVVDTLGAEPATSEDGKYRAYPVIGFDPALGFELYECEMDAGAALCAAAHPGGTQEIISVSKGELSLGLPGETYVLGPNKTIRFAADQVHEYKNSAEKMLRFSMIVAYTRKS